MKENIIFPKNVSGPSNPPDELAQNVSKKNPRRTIYSCIFSAKVQNLAVFQYLHDSNSIFWAQGIKSEGVSGGTVHACMHACMRTDRQTDTDTDTDTDTHRHRLESKRPRVNGDVRNSRLTKGSHATSEVVGKETLRRPW